MDDTIEEKDSFKDTLLTIKRTFVFGFEKEPVLISTIFFFAIVLAAVIYLQIASFSQIVNEIIHIQDGGLGITRELIRQAIILAVSFLIPAILQNLQAKYSTIFDLKMQTHIELLQVDSYSSLDIGTVEGTEFQTKLERASKWGIGSITNVFYYSKFTVADIAGFVTSGLILFFISPYLVLLAIVGTLPYYFVEKKFGLILFRLYHLWTDNSRIENDRLSYFRDVKKLIEILLFNTKNFFRNQIKNYSNDYNNEVFAVQKKKSLATFGADLLQTICLFIAIFFVTVETLHGRLLVGSLLLAFSAYRGFVSTTQSFFENFSRVEEQSRFAKRWFDIFDIKSRLVDKVGAVHPDWSTPPKIEFKNVSFSYPNTETMILKNISFVLESGEKMAIVGQNGAGKTTLVKLLCRIYDPTEGQILVNGIDLRDIELERWRRLLGILFQDYTNYNMTIRESIAITKPDEPINDEKVRWAAEMTDAAEFIKDLPKQYDQLVWKGYKDGTELSKGQFQRLAVARIFYRDSLISVLDEPTSAIDAVAEEKIFEVLEKKMEGKTVVLISHRFSTVKNADAIAVIEHGELKELGNHKELMAKKGRYQELFTMQADRYLEE